MDAILTSIPALIVLGALGVPLVVYLLVGLGDGAISRSRTVSQRLRPWWWLLLPLALMGLILVYPLVETAVLSFFDARGREPVGLENYAWTFGSAVTDVLVNTGVWIVVYPLGTVVLALLAALLFDRVRYEKLAMTLIVLPSAVSFTAASVIWRQFYSFQPANAEQRGTVNALFTLIPGVEPVAWLQTRGLNTLALIFVAVWSTLGLSALILSAALKNVPAELVEAARLDGAGFWIVLRRVTLPSIAPALLVVVTTSIIFALKVFDIVFVMTNGNFGTDTIANRMYYELFAANNLGHASAIAVLLLLVAIPVVVLNIRQFEAETE